MRPRRSESRRESLQRTKRRASVTSHVLGADLSEQLVFMNVHVFTDAADLDSHTLRARASLLIDDATFVDGWRAVPLSATDSLPDPLPDTVALDDFVHYIYDPGHSSFGSLPSPGQPRTRSHPGHSPASFLSQRRQPSSAQEESVHQPTLFDQSAFYTRQSDAPVSLSIYGLGGQPSTLPSHLHDSTSATSAPNILPPSILSRASFDTAGSNPVPPNQLELYARQDRSPSMRSGSQDSLYGSREFSGNIDRSGEHSSSHKRVSHYLQMSQLLAHLLNINGHL